MLSDRLAIPLSHNPARQKLWRAIGLLVFLVCTLIAGYLIDRLIHFRTTPQRWPAEANLEIRLIKTPRVSKLVNQGFKGVQALPGTPWDIPTALTWSKREFILYGNDTATLGLVVDGDIPAGVLEELSVWGWTANQVGGKTLITKSSDPEPDVAKRRLNLWLTLPIFDGAIVAKNASGQITTAPFSFSSATSLDFPINTEQFIPAADLALPPDTQLLGNFSLPASVANPIIPTNIPAAFPGMQMLSAISASQETTLLLGQDDQGLAFVLATSSPGYTPEELGAIASEGLGLQRLSTQVLTNDSLGNAVELRSSAEITVEVRNENGLSVALAKTPTGDLFRLTQSATQLILSNRSPIIGLDSAIYSGTCLNRAQGYLAPKLLAETTGNLVPTRDHSLFSRLQSVNEINYRKNRLRICW